MEFMRPTTVAGAVAPLLKVLDNLEGVVLSNIGKIETNNGMIKHLEGENHVAHNERVNAAKVIEALGAIVKPQNPARG